MLFFAYLARSGILASKVMSALPYATPPGRGWKSVFAVLVCIDKGFEKNTLFSN